MAPLTGKKRNNSESVPEKRNGLRRWQRERLDWSGEGPEILQVRSKEDKLRIPFSEKSFRRHVENIEQTGLKLTLNFHNLIEIRVRPHLHAPAAVPWRN